MNYDNLAEEIARLELEMRERTATEAMMIQEASSQRHQRLMDQAENHLKQQLQQQLMGSGSGAGSAGLGATGFGGAAGTTVTVGGGASGGFGQSQAGSSGPIRGGGSPGGLNWGTTTLGWDPGEEDDEPKESVKDKLKNLLRNE